VVLPRPRARVQPALELLQDQTTPTWSASSPPTASGTAHPPLQRDRGGPRRASPTPRAAPGSASASTTRWRCLGEKGTLNPGGERGPAARPQRRLPPTERRALEILDARTTSPRPEIRKIYKALVKDLHPDMNGGKRDDEARLTEVVWAWEQIKGSRSFPD
jgi:hypothetical protein